MKMFKNNILLIIILLLATLVFSSTSCSEKTIISDDEHTEAIGLIIYYNNEPFFKVQNGKIDTMIAPGLTFKLGLDYSPLEVKFIDPDGEIITPIEAEKSLSWIIADTSLIDLKLITNEKWKMSAEGKRVGTTQIEFLLMHGEHPDFRTPKIPLKVVD